MSKANTGGNTGANAEPVAADQRADGQYGRSEAQVDKERAEEERQVKLNKGGQADMNDAIKADDDRERA